MFKFDIKEISKDDALKMIQKYHYSNTLPKINKYFLGFYLDEELVRCGYAWMGNKATTHHTENFSESGYKRLSGDWRNVYDGRDATKQ